MIDLHCHTTASDGTLSPAALIERAAADGFTHLAITDHDSVAGVKQAAPLAQRLGICLIPGVELSSRLDEQPVDILGYGIDPDAPALVATLEAMVEARNQRMPRMIQRLREAGIEIEMADVERFAEGGVVGRPHLARALVAKGFATSVADAFDRYLGRSCIAYVPKEALSPARAIEVIRAAGGLAVLAHPCYLRFEPAALVKVLDELVAAGLGGIEAYYSQHTAQQVERFERLGRERGLVITGGSDFHGSTKPDIRLGAGPGGKPLPVRLACDLLAAIEKGKGTS